MRGLTGSSRLWRCALAALFSASATFTANADVLPRVVSASLSSKTDRYGHGVLGGNEYALLAAFIDRGPDKRVALAFVKLPEERVFEDVAARLADLDGDGVDEIIVVESDAEAGSQLAVYGLRNGRFRIVAATPPIGQPYRWLAPAGIADFNGDGQNDVAYVETPHIGGILRIWTMRDGNLVEIASGPGYSNHRIGQNFITGGVRDCGNGPELVLPNADWSQTLVARLGARLEGGVIESAVLAEDASPETVARAMECP